MSKSGSVKGQLDHINTFSQTKEFKSCKVLNLIGSLDILLLFSRNNALAHLAWGVSESTDKRGCAILAFEMLPKNLIFA